MPLGWFPALPRREPRGRGGRSICGRAERPDVQPCDPSSLAGASGYHCPERAAKMTALAHPGLEFLLLHAESQGSVLGGQHFPTPGRGPAGHAAALPFSRVPGPDGVLASPGIIFSCQRLRVQGPSMSFSLLPHLHPPSF